jgi:hypothetical protein
MSEFKRMLKVGKVGEGAIAQWLKHRGNHVMPVYELEKERGKGPQLFSALGSYIAPDMFVFKSDGTAVVWIEAKTKTRFSWYGKGKYFVTGIDTRHYTEYCKVQDISPWEVWLMFLHTCSETWASDIEKWNAPAQCPTGLFGNKLNTLKNSVSHVSEKDGMTYWRVDALQHFAALEEIEIIIDGQGRSSEKVTQP